MVETHIKNKDEAVVINLFEEFLDVITRDYEKYPSKSNFAKYLNIKRTEVYEWFSLHPHAKAKIEALMSDVLVEGMLLKKYTSQGAIFTLKNVCKWEDSPKQKTQNEKSSEKDSEKLLDEYIREKRGLKQSTTSQLKN